MTTISVNFDPDELSSSSVSGLGLPSIVKLPCDGTEVETKSETLDDLFKALGGFSYFQLWLTCMLIFPEIPSSMIVTSTVFTGSGSAPFTCQNSEQLGPTSSFTSNQTAIYTGLDTFICSSSNCSSRHPLGTPFQSIVQEWDLVCDRAWITDTCQSLHMGGMMTGAFLVAILSDRFGRKPAFYFTVLMMGIFGTASALVSDIYSYGTTRYLAGIGTGGYYVAYNIYIIEFLTPSCRTLCGCLSLWFIGEILLALLAYLIPSWKILTILTSLPALIIFLAYPFIPESPKWLLCHGKTKEATKVLNQIARWNSKSEIDHQTTQKFQASILSEEESHDKTKNRFIMAIAEVLRSTKLSLRLAVFVYSWFAVALVYYGVTFNVKNLSGDPYLNLVYMGLTDFFGFPFGALFNNCAVFLVGLVVVEETIGLSKYPLLITTLCLVAKFGVAAAWGTLTLFTAESFPTVVRCTCLGVCSLAGNIGGVLAPQLAFLGILHPAMPYYSFCGIAVLAAGLSCFLKETNRQTLSNFLK